MEIEVSLLCSQGDFSPLSSAEAKNVRSITFTSPVERWLWTASCVKLWGNVHSCSVLMLVGKGKGKGSFLNEQHVMGGVLGGLEV